MRPIRSLLICTTTVDRHLQSALASCADAVVLDLETTILDSEKSAARMAATGVLAKRHQPDIFVRINEIDSRHVFDDLMALGTPNLRGIMLPQAEDRRQIEILDWMLSNLERRYSRTGPPVEILPLVETARGVENLANALPASKRIRQVTFGVADYSLDTGMQPSRDESELAYIRAKLVHSSRACGLEAPIDTVWLDLNDTDGLQMSLQRSRRQGFSGKLCIHPRQAEQANLAFTPSAEEVTKATAIIAAFEVAMANNVAAVRVEGRLVDLPIVRSAQRTVDFARMLAEKSAE